MSRPSMPGFKYDAKKKVATFWVYPKGGGGRVRRKKTVRVRSIEHAREEYATFRRVVSLEAPDEDATFEVLVERELPRILGRVKKSTAKNYTSTVTFRLLPYFKHMPVRDIDKAATELFVEALRSEKKPASPARINGCIRVLKMLLHEATEQGYIQRYPLRSVKLLSYDLPKLELKRDEQSRFLAAFTDEAAFTADLEQRMPKGTVREFRPVPGIATTKRRFGSGMRPDSPAAKAYWERFSSFRQFFHLAILTGIRKEDLRGLEWSNVDIAGKWIRLKQRKTGSMVAVPLTDAAKAALLELRARRVMSTHVFVDAKGKQISSQTVRIYFALAKRLAGITRRCRFHDLRHTFGSNAASAGIELQYIKSAMGHSSVAMTERYSRPDEESIQNAFRSVEKPG